MTSLRKEADSAHVQPLDWWIRCLTVVVVAASIGALTGKSLQAATPGLGARARAFETRYECNAAYTACTLGEWAFCQTNCGSWGCFCDADD